MTIPNDGSYYAEGRTVFKAPLREPREDGGADITIGFPVCTASEWVTKEAPQTIADALNAARSPAQEGGETDPKERLPRDADIILEALNEYDAFMLDDDYDAQGCLTRIMKRMRERYEMVDRSPQPDPRDAPLRAASSAS